MFTVKKRTWKSTQVAGPLLVPLTARPIALKRVPVKGFETNFVDLVIAVR